MLQSKLRDQYCSFTASEKKIADFIQNNQEQAKTITSYELAKELKVGQSTIIRFSQRLGYKSFRELLADISIESNSELMLDDIEFHESTALTMKKITSRYFDIIALTNELNDPSIVDKAVHFMEKASIIVCFGVGNSNYFAEYLAGQLITFGTNAQSFTNAHLVYSRIFTLTKGDVLILFSESGESREVVYAARQARKQGVKVIAVTKGSKNSLRQLADVTLLTVNYDVHNFLRTATIRCSQLCVIDIVTLSFYKRHYAHRKEYGNKGRKLIQEVFPRIK